MSATSRMRVFYVEDGARVEYIGTVTERDPARGLFRVWFDTMRSTEQEWVDENDEWEWLDEEMPAAEPGDEDLPLVAVRLFMLASHEDLPPHFARLPATTQALALQAGKSAASGSSKAAEVLQGSSGPSPRSFGKKARTLAAAPAPEPPAPSVSRPSREAAAGARAAAQAAAAPKKEETAGVKRKAPEEKVPRPERKTHPSRSGKRKPKDAAAVAAAAEAAAAAAEEEAEHNAQQPGYAAQVQYGAAPGAPAQGKAAAGMRASIASTLKVRAGLGPLLVLPEAVAERALAAMTQTATTYPPADAAAKYGLCALSGLPAKYRDPRTGERYGSIEAFRQLRARHEAAAAAGETESAAAMA